MSKRKLLLADDSMTIQKVVNLTFADEGIEVFSVGTGTEAIERLSEIAPDLVLADVYMPGLNGYQVCEQVKQNPDFKNVPVMLLVGSFEPFDEAEARRVGADDFLTKPFQSIRQLVQKVTMLLDSPTNSISADDQAAQPQFAAENAASPTADVEADESDSDFALDSAESPKIGLGDAGMDDEMIETNSISGYDNGESTSAAGDDQTAVNNDDLDFNLDDLAEPEARPTEPLSLADVPEIHSSFAEPLPNSAAAKVPKNDLSQEENDFVFESNSFTAETAPPPTSDWQQSERNAHETSDINVGSAENDVIEIYDFADVSPQTNGDDETINPAANAVQTASQPDARNTFVDFDFDDLNFLQLDDNDENLLDLQNDADDEPLSFEQDFAAPADSQEIETASSTALITTAASQNALTEVGSQAVAKLNLDFPPEVIEAIAQRVVEKLSDKVIEKIAWEIVPDRFDLIVRKHMNDRER